MANEAMQTMWDGEEGDHWAEHADHYDAASARIVEHYLGTVDVAPDTRILDVGCGAGGLAVELAKRCPGGSVLGVDLSSRMLEVGAKRAAAAGVTNVEFMRADAQTHVFDPGSFDVAVSSFGAMFFDDHVAAFSNIASALKPGGRVSLLAWRRLQDNEWLMGIRDALAMGRDLPFPPLEAPTPFSLSDPARTAALLGAAGFTDVESTAIDQPMVLGTDADDAFGFFGQAGLARGLSHDLEPAAKEQGLAKLRQFFADHETPEGVVAGSAAWLITAEKAA